MQTVLVEDEKGLDMSPEKNDKAVQISVKTEKRRRLRSFTVVSLFILLFISFAATGWLYMGKTALTQVRDNLSNENQAMLASLDVMSQKAELLENKISKLQSQNETLENQNETLVNQGQTLKAQSEALGNKNEALVAQNEKLTNKVSILADQLDKASRVYRQRLAELQAKNDILTAENAALLEKNTQPTGQNKTPRSPKHPLETGEAYSIASGATSKELIALIEPLGEYGKSPPTKKTE